MRIINERNISISYKQSLWLTSMGDRDVDDVYADAYQKVYILMWSSKKGDYKKVYLPNNNNLKIKMLDNYHKISEIIN